MCTSKHLDPKIVIALGDCAIDCGMFKNSYAVTGPVERHIPVGYPYPRLPATASGNSRGPIGVAQSQNSNKRVNGRVPSCSED